MPLESHCWFASAQVPPIPPVQGGPAELESFLAALRTAHPPQARIDALEVQETECEACSPGDFRILASLEQGIKDVFLEG